MKQAFATSIGLFSVTANPRDAPIGHIVYCWRPRQASIDICMHKACMRKAIRTGLIGCTTIFKLPGLMKMRLMHHYALLQ